MQEKVINPNPLVSICIPTFNSAAYVWRALESAIHQTYKNIEIVVVDNASSDGTKQLVREYAARDKRVKFFENGMNIGSGRNFLKCAEYASGKFIEALGADDWLSRNYIEEGVKNFLANPDIVSVFAGDVTLSLAGNGEIVFVSEAKLKSRKYSADWFFSHFYRHPSISGRGFHSFMRRNDFIEALKETLGDSINMFQRGERKEPFDVPVFLNALAKYKSFLVIKNSAYLKTMHGKDHVGLQGESFESSVGQIRYATATRKSFEVFFLKRGFKKHFNRLRFFGGLSIAVNAILSLLKNRLAGEGKKGYFSAVKDYFENYSKKEKLLIMISVAPYVFLRIVNRFVKLFTRKSSFVPSQNYFLTDKLEFKVYNRDYENKTKNSL